MQNSIVVKGARQHNLKNIDIELPRDELIVFTGVSGSGKSSLAFDTIYNEGQRRYVESLTPMPGRFLGRSINPMWILLEACHRPFPSTRSLLPIIRVQL